MILRSVPDPSTNLYGGLQTASPIPSGSVLHPVFPVSRLKPKLGNREILVPTLLPLDASGAIHPEPEQILNRLVRKVHNRAITELLVRRHGQTHEHATWEGFEKLKRLPTKTL